MKKLMIVAAVAVMALAAVGCSKSKDCNCKTTQSMSGMDPVVTTSVITAEDGDCDALSHTSTTNGVTSTIKCE